MRRREQSWCKLICLILLWEEMYLTGHTRLLLDGEQWTQVDEVPVQLQGIVAAMENG